MAGTIGWAEARELAAFHATRGCAVSLYLDLDPSVTPTAGDVETRVNALLREGERRLEEARDSLDHTAVAGAEADLRRIGGWFATEFDRSGVRGVAVFAAGADDLWRTVESIDPVPDDVRIAADLYLLPLMPVVGRGSDAVVAFVGRERGDVYRLEGGRLVEIADRSDSTPGRHDQGGWSQARYERHIEDIVDRHLRRVADTLDRCVERGRECALVLVGTEAIRRELESMLAQETRAAIAGWTTAEAHADTTELLAAARPVLEAHRARGDERLLERWQQEAGREGRATAGWEATVEAASDGRVDTLLVHAAVSAAMKSRGGALDVAVRETLVNGGTVRVIGDRRDLEPVGGVAALLRY